MKKQEKGVSTIEKDKEISEENENVNKGKTFGDKIVEGRIKKTLSQEAFAEKMGVSRQMVSRWELNTAMPRTQRIKKISEILEIPIEELMSSKFKKDFANPVAINRINLKAVMKSIAVILIILFVLYFAYVGYKFMILNGISSKLEQYKNLDNYYFKMESMVDGVLQETKEIWYKDGLYKIIITTNNNNMQDVDIKYYDLNKNVRYIVNEEEKSYMERQLITKELYEDGQYMYSLFPSMVNGGATDFKQWAFKLNLIYAYYKDESLLLKINDEYLEFDKKSFLPISQFITMKENKNTQLNNNIYSIKLNSTTDDDVNVPLNYSKLN